MSVVRRFMAAFEGSDLAHGKTTVGRVARNGKAEAKSVIVREPTTEALVEAHLSGQRGLGSIPINSKNLCRFGVIDVDEYDLDHRAVQSRVSKFNLPLIVCRSKSGGAHLYLFLDDWYEARLVREYLGEMASALGYAGRELFPKQDHILIDRGDVGNFINLPYFDAENTVRYAVDEDGEAMDLEAFLDCVERSRVPLSRLEKIEYGQPREDLKHFPPCLERLLSQGVTEYRNVVLFNTTVTLKKAHPDNWQQALEEMNVRHCPTPLEAAEIVNLQKQHEKKDWGYQCKATPLCDFCDRELCKTRKYGVTSGGPIDFPKLAGMSVLMSDPKVFFLDMDGKRLQLSARQLHSQSEFQQACIEQIQRRPPSMKESDWSGIVNGLLQGAIQIEAAPELTLQGQLEQHLRDYCTSGIRAMVPEEMVMGKPWTDKGLTKFTFAGFLEFLRQRNMQPVTRVQIQNFLKDMNGGDNCNGHQGVRKEDGTMTTIRVWWVPAYDDKQVNMRSEDDNEGQIPF